MAKVSVNAPCPCGSGKKYKKCCKAADEAAERKARSSPIPEALETFSFTGSPPPRPAAPPDPLAQTRLTFQERFEAADHETSYALATAALEEPDLIDGEMLFDVFGNLFHASARRGERARFDALMERVAERLPAVCQEEIKYVVGWRLENAVVRGEPAGLGSAVQAVVSIAVDHPDVVEETLDALAFHGYGNLLGVFVEAMWTSPECAEALGRAGRRAQRAARLFLADRVERGVEADTAAATRLFGNASVEEATSWLAGVQASGTTTTTSAAPVLLAELAGHLRREEGVPYCMAELGTRTLAAYFRERESEGRKAKAALIPDRKSLDEFLAGWLRAPFSWEPYSVVAALEILPSWLRFLSARGFLPERQRRDLESSLKGLAATVAKVMAGDPSEDPALARALEAWPRTTRRAPEEAGALKWSLTPPPPGARKPDTIDWKRAVRGVPTESFFDGRPLDEAIDDFVYWVEKGRFVAWEAVIREEQDLPLTPAQSAALDELLSFDEEDADARTRYIDGSPRPDRPWFEILRELAKRLVVELPLSAERDVPFACFDAWPSLVAILKSHGADLSLPPGAATPIEVVPAELRHRLDLQFCLEPLVAFDADDPASTDPIGELTRRLANHGEAATAMGFTPATLPTFVDLPPTTLSTARARLSSPPPPPGSSSDLRG